MIVDLNVPSRKKELILIGEINFSENSQLKEIGKGAFLGAAIETIELPKSCTKLGLIK